MKRRCLLALLAAAVAMVVLTPGAALGANDHLACKLTRPKLVKGVFEFRHSQVTSSAASPTAPPPEDHAVDGADESVCDVRVWSDFPESASAFGRPPNFSVAACCGAVSVTTFVQDTGQPGEEYDAKTWWNTLSETAIGLMRKLKGGGFGMPRFGASRDFAFWFGSKEHVAMGYWQVHDGFVQIQVLAHTDPRPKLSAVAHHIVPAFGPYG